MCIWKVIFYSKFEVAICFESSERIVDFLRGIWKPLCKDGVLDERFLVYADSICLLDDASIDIG